MGREDKQKNNQKQFKEQIIDYNPDDLEANEDLQGFKIINGEKKEINKNRDLNPDDFE